ncbi:MAG: ECF-type sigma factor, partial [Planctomycetota bacterium]
EAPGHTLQATALVHEAYVRLVGEAALPWQNRAHFFGAAARAMRQILVDSARRRRAAKRGGDRGRVGLDQLEIAADQPVLADPDQLLALDEAVDRLSQRDARKAQIVMLRFFAGLTIEQTAHAMSLSPTTVKDEWQFARAWLFNELTRHDGAET